MNCAQVKAEETIERYLLGELDEEVQTALEQHFYECAECLEDLETTRALQSELRRAEATIRAEAPGRSRSWQWAVAAAVALVVAIGITRQSREPEAETSHRSILLAELGSVVPPTYAPARLRGAPDEAQRTFSQAMKSYPETDYTAAIPQLQIAAGLDPRAPNIGFFLGICLLLEGEANAAIDTLGRTVALGESLYLEEAHFYLAKAHLQVGDEASAREQLETLRDLQGDLQGEAEQLLDRLGESSDVPD